MKTTTKNMIENRIEWIETLEATNENTLDVACSEIGFLEDLMYNEGSGISVSDEQLAELKKFYQARKEDEARKGDKYYSGTVAGITFACMILGIADALIS